MAPLELGGGGFFLFYNERKFFCFARSERGRDCKDFTNVRTVVGEGKTRSQKNYPLQEKSLTTVAHRGFKKLNDLPFLPNPCSARAGRRTSPPPSSP